jgi:hypothetical protein
MSFLAGAALGLAAYDAFASGGQTLTVTNNVLTNMSVDATFRSTTECFQSIDSTQNIQVANTGDNYSLGKREGCTACLNALQAITAQRTKTEADAQRLSGGSYQAQVASDTAADLLLSGSSGGTGGTGKKPRQLIGACTLPCNDLVVSSIKQSVEVEAKQTCNVTQVVDTEVQQKLSGTINQYLKNQQDILGQLESAFTTNSDSISNDLSATLTQNIDTNFAESLHSSARALQGIEIGAGAQGITEAHSMYVTNVTQAFKGTQISSLTSTNTILNQLRQSASFSISQALINKNDTTADLTGDLLKVLNNMSKLIEDVVTRLLVILAAVIVAVAVVIGARYILDERFRAAVTSRLDTVSNKVAGK